MSCAGLAGAMTWSATAGADPRAVTGSFDLPIACLGLVLLGFFIWMAGMARRERADAAAWARLYATRRAVLPPLSQQQEQELRRLRRAARPAMSAPGALLSQRAYELGHARQTLVNAGESQSFQRVDDLAGLEQAHAA